MNPQDLSHLRDARTEPAISQVEMRTMSLEYATRSINAWSPNQTESLLGMAAKIYAYLQNGPAPVDGGDKAA